MTAAANNRQRATEKRQLIKKFCDTSTMHGIADLYAASTIFDRTFWILAIIGALSAAAYGCYAIFDHYRESPLAASYTVKHEPSRQLPDLILCPFSRFNASFLSHHNISSKLAQYAQLAFGFSPPYHFMKPPNFNDTEHLILGDELNELLGRLNMSFLECNEYIQYCVSAEEQMFDCCKKARNELTVLGVCFRIPGVTQRNAGYGFGLTLVIKTANHSLIAPSYNILHNDGISVKLAERTRGVDLDLTFLPSGTHALMPLRATKYEFLDGHPLFHCIMDVPKGFSSTRCFEACFFRPIEQECNCTHIIISKHHPFDLRGCIARDIIQCAMPYLRRERQLMQEIMKHCQARCKSPCHYWEFQPTVSYAEFPSGTIQRYIPFADYEDMKKYIILEIFYEQLDYTLIKHHPSMTPDTFIANVGGQIGLWIGGSVLTAIQVVVFGLQIFWFCLKRSRKNAGR